MEDKYPNTFRVYFSCFFDHTFSNCEKFQENLEALWLCNSSLAGLMSSLVTSLMTGLVTGLVTTLVTGIVTVPVRGLVTGFVTSFVTGLVTSLDMEGFGILQG